MEVLFKRMRTTEGSKGDGEGKAGAEEEAVNEAAAVAVGAEEEMELHIQRIMVRIEQFTEKVSDLLEAGRTIFKDLTAEFEDRLISGYGVDYATQGPQAGFPGSYLNQNMQPGYCHLGTGADFISQDYMAHGSQDGEPRDNPSKNQTAQKKDGKPIYPTEPIESPYFGSSVHYGGMDFFACSASSSTSVTAKTHKNNEDDGSDNSNFATRGDWWPGSLYY